MAELTHLQQAAEELDMLGPFDFTQTVLEPYAAQAERVRHRREGDHPEEVIG